MWYRYYFHIIDNEMQLEYDYEGDFADHFEADTFIQENEAVGNIVTMMPPFYEAIKFEDTHWYKED